MVRRKLRDTEELLEVILRAIIGSGLQEELAKYEPLLRNVLGPTGETIAVEEPQSPTFDGQQRTVSRLDQNQDEQMQAMARTRSGLE